MLSQRGERLPLMIDSKIRRYVIIGNGFAGTTAAEQLRKNDASCNITLFTDEPYPLYNRISLPPMLRHQIPEAKVMMRTVEWHAEHGIDFFTHTKVEHIFPAEHRVVANGQSYPYDALLIATGGRPNGHPALDSKVVKNVFNFQYLDDTRALDAAIDNSAAAVAIGGSFIAYELAEAYAARGLETHWVMRGKRFLHRMLDEDAGALVDEAAREQGVHLHYGHEVHEFVCDNDVVKKITLVNGTEIVAQCFGIGLGLTMNTELLAGSGIASSKNGILCDDRLETNIPGIFAAGDIADFYDPILEYRYRMGTWNNAGAHGKVVAMNMAGGDERYHDVPEYSSQLFKGQTITQFGLSPDLQSELESVTHLNVEKKWYRALYFWRDRLVGGLLLGKGNRAGKRKYVEAIKSKVVFANDDRRALLEWTA